MAAEGSSVICPSKLLFTDTVDNPLVLLEDDATSENNDTNDWYILPPEKTPATEQGTNQTMVCKMCDQKFLKSKHFNTHIKKTHDVKFSMKNERFLGMYDFNSWLKIQQKLSRFVVSHVKKVGKNTVTHYKCHLSDTPIVSKNGIRRYHCPATIVCTEFAVGSVSVKFLKTHFGHPTEAEMVNTQNASVMGEMLNEHEALVAVTSMKFRSRSLFESWREKFHKDHMPNYTISLAEHCSAKKSSVTYFLCNESETVRLGDEDITQCPARIKCTELTDGTVFAKVCETHFGHRNESETSFTPVIYNDEDENLPSADDDDDSSLDILAVEEPELCLVCGKSFENLRRIRKHIRDDHDSYTNQMKCAFCSKSFQTNKDFDGHCKRAHDFSAVVKSLEFISKGEFETWLVPFLKKHMWNFTMRLAVKSSPKDPLVTYYACNESISTSKERNHCTARIVCAEFTHGKTYVTFCVAHFGHGFPNPRKRKINTPCSENRDNNITQCELSLDNVFDIPRTVKKQRIAASSDDSNSNTVARNIAECELCGVNCNNGDSLKDHMNSVHSSCVEQPSVLNCDKCVEKFLTNKDLDDHLKQTHNCEIILNSAEFVKKQRIADSSDDSNSNTVTRNTAECELCGLCGENCNNGDSLKDHMNSVHPSSVEQPSMLNCDKCVEKFLTNKDLDDHLKQTHNCEIILKTAEFPNRNSFDTWRRMFHTQHLKNFAINRATKCPVGIASVTYYACVESQNTATNCPARITCIEFSDGTIHIKFCETHFGHDTDPPTQLELYDAMPNIPSLEKNCAICCKTFQNYQEIDIHIQQDHMVNYQLTEMNFDSRIEYETFRHSFHAKHLPDYTIEPALDRSDGTYYFCNGSRTVDTNGEENDGKTVYYCPARVHSTQQANGSFSVKFIFTHTHYKTTAGKLSNVKRDTAFMKPAPIIHCSFCDLGFQDKLSHINHVNRTHKEHQEPELKCATCSEKLHSRKDFDAHIMKAHDVNVSLKQFEFQTMPEFDTWQWFVQKMSDTHTRYVKSYLQQCIDRATILYECEKSAGIRNKRQKKKPGEYYCPARIMLTAAKNQPIQVVYCETHFGHKVRNKENSFSQSGEELAEDIRRRHLSAKRLKNMVVKSVSDSSWTVSASENTRFIVVLLKDECSCEPNFHCMDCNICIHKFGCRCKDSFINSRMCEHIHLVGQYLIKIKEGSSLPDVEKKTVDDFEKYSDEEPENTAPNDDNGQELSADVVKKMVLDAVVPVIDVIRTDEEMRLFLKVIKDARRLIEKGKRKAIVKNRS